MESNADLMQDIYEQFFEEGGPGCVGFKNVFDKNTMDEYNKFCEKYIETDAKHHSNCRHPKQLGKYVINNLMGKQIRVLGNDRLAFNHIR